MRNEYQQARASRIGKEMTKKISVMVQLGKDLTTYDWTCEVAGVLERYNGIRTTRIAMQQMRISAYNLLGVEEQ